MISRKEFIERWKKWDRRPTGVREAIEFEEACRQLGESIGKSTTQVRILLGRKRREGLSKVECYEWIVGNSTG